MSHFLIVSQQTFWQILGKIVTALSTLLILSLVARKFGESGTGVFTLAVTYLSFFYLMADFGINAYILPRMMHDGWDKQWRKLLGLRLVWSGLLMILALFLLPILPFNQPQFNLSILLGVLAIFGSTVFVTSNAIFQSRLRYDLSVLASSFGSLVTLLATFVIIQSFLGISFLMLAQMLGWLICGMIALIFVRQFFKNITPLFEPTFIKQIFFQVWPISLTLVLNVIYFRLDSFILTYFKSFTEVGIYNLSYQIFQSALVLPTFIMNSFYPLMLEDFAENRSKFVTRILRALGLMLVLALLGTILTIILAPLVIRLITGGQGFVGSVTALRILPLGFPAFFLSSLLMWTLVVLKKYKILLGIYFIGLIFNGVANLIFIPQYSYLAASWITVISEYLILLMQLTVLRGILIP